MFLLWILTIGALIYWIYQLQKRITKLESSSLPQSEPQTLKANEESSSEPVVVDDGVDRSKWPTHLKNKAVASTVAKKEPEVVTPPFDFEQFLGQKLFPILGATSIVLAIGFFAIWAFANGWVGPMGRIATGILVSLGLIGLGEYLKNKYPDFFTSLVAAGLAGLIITTLIAHYAYDFISPFQALVLVALQAGAGVVLSLRYDSRILANFSIAAGLLAPWFSGQLEPMVVLPFVTILSLAGFVLALHKKWPEIFAGILLFGSSYLFSAVAKLNQAALEFDRDFKEALSYLGEGSVNPLLLLGFAALIYGLVASAGIVRLILNYKEQEPPKEESGEIVIFTFSLLLFNLVSVGVFTAQDWQHIGFLVLFQALILFGLAEWFKSKNWFHFQQLTLSSSLLFIILATLWEMRNFEPLILTTVLVIEAILMCTIGQMSKTVMYEWFGRITLFIAYGYSLSVKTNELFLEALLALIFIAGFVYSIGRPQQLAEKIWLGVSLFFASEILFRFSFDSGFFPEFLAPLLPVIWILGLTYLSDRLQSFFLRVTACIAFSFVSVGVMGLDIDNSWLYLSTWFWILIMGMGLFALRAKINENSNRESIFGYSALILLVFSWVYQTAQSLEEPILTVSWLAMIGVLMTLGLSFKQFNELRFVGLGFMLMVIAKIYLIDIWQWDTPIRVVAFSALGVALLGIGFFYQKIWLKK